MARNSIKIDQDWLRRQQLLEQQQGQLQTGWADAGTPIDVPRPVTETQGVQGIPDDAPAWLVEELTRTVQPVLSDNAAGGNDGGAGNTGSAGRSQSSSGSGSGIPQIGAYDPDSNAAYQSAMQALNAAMGNMPVYSDTYGDQLTALMDKILNRDPFQYDLGSDMLYQQYRDQAMANGRLAMQDTMGRAAALTGGYGSTYSQQVGQQAYDAYLRTLNEQIPALYGQALSAYNAEGDRLAQQFGIVANARNDEYGRYRDSVNDYWNNVNFAANRADTAYSQGYQQWQSQYNTAWDQYNAELAQDQLSYNRESDSYDRMMQLITNTGYQPTPEELEAAGMSQQQADAWGEYYRIQQELAAQKAAGSYSSGRSGGGGSRNSSGDGSDDLGEVEMSMLDYMKSLGKDQAAYYAAQSYAAQNTPNERQYKAIMDEYEYWFNNLPNNDENPDNDVTPLYLSQQEQDGVEYWTQILLQIDDMNEREARLDKLADTNQITGAMYEVLYGAVMGAYGYGGYSDPNSIYKPLGLNRSWRNRDWKDINRT